MANPASPPDIPSHRSLAALEGTAPCSVRHIGPDADEPSTRLSHSALGSRDEMIDEYRPPVRRVDGAHGNRTLLCSCPSTDAHAS
ncbi:hypothetical protein [Streptomyces sioyaensis]|uniref:hypothetical protein n=1 Tax=Streptomyces sioyaensis TaxID=67364 RepID=UPI0036EF074A